LIALKCNSYCYAEAVTTALATMSFPEQCRILAAADTATIARFFNSMPLEAVGECFDGGAAYKLKDKLHVDPKP
jgi:coenzyme F420-reducing hydrogenase delta subunit